jgi:mannose-6-phosphate isomerase-like protein (cupin superfamily)
MRHITDRGAQPFVTNIESVTLENTNYRTALWTGKYIQITVMAILPGHNIGLEKHDDRDQFLRIEEGEATVYMGHTEHELDSWQASGDDAIFVPAGAWHDLVNSGNITLKLYSIYGPPEHPHGTVHETKADADADEAEH